MFEEGDIVTYKDITGKVVFACELSISILVGDEEPYPNQTRIVVYSYEWDKVKKASDSSETVTPAKSQLMNRPLFPPKGRKPCIVYTSSKNT
tara:strand:+ start:562 stop:837 length:276 start_codon:yes stop_codon:yes gene_type:complete